MKLIKLQSLTLILIILALAAYRLLPHPANATPVMAMALFAGTYFEKKWMAFIVPLVAMFLADLFLGLHKLIPFVYFAMSLSVLLGFYLRNSVSTPKVIATSITSSLLFYLISNFAVWLVTDYYEKTLTGLIACYSLALPFLQKSMLGDLFFCGLLFSSYQYVINVKKASFFQSSR